MNVGPLAVLATNRGAEVKVQRSGRAGLLHHAETVILEGKSYRMKDQIEAP
jgi:hypothetical protein